MEIIYDRVINFGALPSLPDGFYVVQLDSGHYMATNDIYGDVPQDKCLESCITVDQFQARRWAFELAKKI